MLDGVTNSGRCGKFVACFFVCVFQAEETNKKMQELNRFVHYYSRFKNHEHSYKVRVE